MWLLQERECDRRAARSLSTGAFGGGRGNECISSDRNSSGTITGRWAAVAVAVAAAAAKHDPREKGKEGKRRKAAE